MKRIVLASSSPRRRELLRLTGLKFEVDPSACEEEMDTAVDPRSLARKLSFDKAKAVSARYGDALVIAADTFILFRGRLLGKPHTPSEARRTLRHLNGQTHSVITGFTVLDTASGKKVSRSVTTKVTFKRLTKAEIDAYVATGEPLDKAGAYAIQGLGALLVRGIQGDYFNVIGLPLSTLADVLAKFGIRVF